MTESGLAARLGRRIAPPRFLLFCAAFAAGVATLIGPLGPTRGTMAAFDIAAALFLLSLVPLLGSETSHMRRHARDNDANRALLLVVTGIVMLVILVSVWNEMGGRHQPLTVALIVATLTLAWLFSNTVYALHYAQLFYSSGDAGHDQGGIDFPATKEPNYWDFAYFSFTLGMTFQTSDTDITSARIRRVVIGHCMAAFVFNIGVLAFTINVLGGGGG